MSNEKSEATLDRARTQKHLSYLPSLFSSSYHSDTSTIGNELQDVLDADDDYMWTEVQTDVDSLKVVDAETILQYPVAENQFLSISTDQYVLNDMFISIILFWSIAFIHRTPSAQDVAATLVLLKVSLHWKRNFYNMYHRNSRIVFFKLAYDFQRRTEEHFHIKYTLYVMTVN